jgi:hypothetical protein
MTGQSRRIRFLLSPRNPIDAEILAWIETLPRSSRGTEMLPHLRAALIDYIRARVRPAGAGSISPEVVTHARLSRVNPPPRAAPAVRDTSQTSSKSGVERPSGALAKHLLKDFG